MFNTTGKLKLIGSYYPQKQQQQLQQEPQLQQYWPNTQVYVLGQVKSNFIYNYMQIYAKGYTKSRNYFFPLTNENLIIVNKKKEMLNILSRYDC